MSDLFKNIDLGNGIAVVGMHCLIPGANSTQQFWENLCNEYEAVQDLSDEELLDRGVAKSLLESPDYVKAAIILDGMEEFDYAFFGTSPRDAAVMDPQHRKFLECAWAALEDSGHKPSDEKGAIGMFAAAGMPWYLIRNVMTHKELVRDMGEFQIRHLSNDKDFLATRASFAMNIHGPSLTVQTACSSSLVAVHLAIQSLLFEESDIAIAGGSTIDVPHAVGYRYREEEVRSSDGRCRAFDRDSSGTAFGSGCAAIVMRRLEDALADGDTVHAVLLGSAVNNDGSEKAGYMAPSVDYQANAIAEAIAVAGISPDSIGYFESHGTGTAIGDPIEVAALTQAFGETKKKQFCGLGSVKTNVGHLDTAAGVTSLIKTICCVREGKIPASLHFNEPNPEIDFENSPFYVNAELRDWSPDDGPRIAGVSSLGVGGTNAHIIVCQSPTLRSTSTNENSAQLLPMSAKTLTSLAEYRKNLAKRLDGMPDESLADVAYTLQEGRVEFENRSFAVGDSASELSNSLTRQTNVSGRARKKPPTLSFMFSGQGSQYPGMTKGLYDTFPVYRSTIDECLTILDNEASVDIRSVLFARRNDKAAASELQDTAMTQPALFVVEYALSQLFRSWGIKPDSMIGHSLGEYVAATVAGVFSLNEAMKLVALRGKLISGLHRGKMVSVARSATELEPYLTPTIALAAENAPNLTVLSGPDSDIEKLSQTLEADGHFVRPLHTSHAFHSSMLDPILEDFSLAVANANPGAPEIPFISNVSGTWITEAQATSPEYWAQHMRSTVRFRNGIDTLAASGNSIFLELGPGNTLATLTQLSLAEDSARSAFSSVPHSKEEMRDVHCLLSAVGNLWVTGLSVPWEKLRGDHKGQRVSLPGYAFDKHRCWLDPVENLSDNSKTLESSPIDEWGYLENWRRQLLPVSNTESALGSVLVFITNDDAGKQLLAELQACSEHVTIVHMGTSFARLDDNIFVVDPRVNISYDELFATVNQTSFDHIVHTWTMLPVAGDDNIDVPTLLDLGFFSLLNIARNFQESSTNQQTRLLISTTNMCDVRGEAVIPAKATLLGPLRVIPSEMPGVEARLVDMDAEEIDGGRNSAARTILHELQSWNGSTVTAYRAGVRYTQSYDRVALPSNNQNPVLDSESVYLITGAFGGLGRSIAEHLAKEFRASLILLSRHGNDSQPNRNSREVFVSYLEKLGSEVHRIEVDLAHTDELIAAMEVVKQRFGKIDGVFHAAGHLDDGLIAMKSRESAAAVLSPKIQGTLSLETAMEWCTPKFQLNYSSISVLAGLPGQADYSAANAFLDAYSRDKNRRGRTRHLSVGWSSWGDTGMSARQAVENNLPASVSGPVQKINGNVFSHVCSRDNGIDFFAAIGPDTMWYLDEHRLKGGAALLPGTAYIELIADAMSLWLGQQPLEISNLIFATPFQVDDREKRILQCEINQQNNSNDYEVAIYSWAHRKDEPLEHVHAMVACLDETQRPATIPTESIEVKSRTPIAQIENPLLDFGRRWSCLQSKSVDADGAKLELRLEEDLAADLFNVPWHPAMMDIATGGAPELYDNNDSESGIVPFRYKTLRLWAPLTQHVFSHISAPTGTETDSPETDIRVVSDSGEILVEIDGFAVRRIDATQLKNPTPGPNRQVARASDRTIETDGMSVADGHEVVQRLLSIGATGHIIISPRNLESAIYDLRQQVSPDQDATEETAEQQTLLDRPELSTDYAEPSSDIESTIADMWQTALGISDIGVDDDFFELGGHSLLLTQIVSKIRREHGWHLPLDKVFDEVTIREWARFASDSSQSAPKMPAIKRIDRQTYRANASAIKISK